MAPSDTSPIDRATLASLPARALGRLAGQRRDPEILVTPEGDRAWVRWPAGRRELVRDLLAIEGAVFYAEDDGYWHRPGSSLPDLDVPRSAGRDGLALVRVLTPELFRPRETESPLAETVAIELVLDSTPRPTTALRAPLAAVADWAESCPSARFRGLTAAWGGDAVLIRGESLPEIAAARRFWGGRLLLPLGYRAEPGLSEDALCSALGYDADHLVVLDEQGAEPIPRLALGPLTRAGCRLAAGSGGP